MNYHRNRLNFIDESCKKVRRTPRFDPPEPQRAPLGSLRLKVLSVTPPVWSS